MDPDDTRESITVNTGNHPTGQRKPKTPRSERERNGSQVSGWCVGCGSHLFILDNEWKQLNQNYVTHARGDTVTATIEVSLEQGTDEFDGTKNLDGCKITYLKCTTEKCNQRVGLHCLRGSPENKFQGLAFLKVKKIALRKNKDTPELDYKIIGDLQPSVDSTAGGGDKDEGESRAGAEPEAGGEHEDERETEAGGGEKNALFVTQTTSQDTSPTGMSNVSLRQKNPEITTPGPPNRAELHGLACKTCQKRSMACDRQRPDCSTCKSMGRQCRWEPNPRPNPRSDPAPASSNTAQKIPLSRLIQDNSRWASSFATASSSITSSAASPGIAVAPANLSETTALESIGSNPTAPASAPAPAPTATMASRTAPSRGPSSGASTPGAPSQVNKRSSVSCANCTLRQKECDRGLPVCTNCRAAHTKCSYKHKKPAPPKPKNAIDVLDPNDNWEPATVMPLADLDEDDYDEDGDMHIQTIPPRSPGSADALESDSHTLQGLSEQLEGQRIMIRNQQNEITALLTKVAQFDGVLKDMEAMQTRLSGFEDLLKRITQSNGLRQSHSTGLMPTFSDPRSDAAPVIDSSIDNLTRPSAPARRGGHSINHSVGRSVSGIVPNKRSFEERESDITRGPTHRTTPQDPNAMDIDHAVSGPEASSKAPNAVQEATATLVRPDTLIRRATSQASSSESQYMEEAATREYLEAHRQDEDSEDDDYEPGNDSVDPDQGMAPDTQDVRSSVERLLTPVPTSSVTRDKSGRFRNRQSVRPQTPQEPYVPSTPISSGTPARGSGIKRRGISGRAPSAAVEYSHSAFSPSQAVTMINDPTPKRPKLDVRPAYDSTPVSFAISPNSIEKAKQVRYPQGRQRDAEGYLLNANGTRDKRSLRGKLLGRSVFNSAKGERRTLERILADQAGDPAAFPSSSPLAGEPYTADGSPSQPAQRRSPDNVPSSVTTANGAATSRVPTAPMTSGFGPVNRERVGMPRDAGAAGTRDTGVTNMASATTQAAPTSTHLNPVNRQPVGSHQGSGDLETYQSRVFSSPPDIRRLAAKADKDRFAQAMAKGQSKQYSARHNEVMSKLKLTR